MITPRFGATIAPSTQAGEVTLLKGMSDRARLTPRGGRARET